MDEITIIIKTIERMRSLKRLLHSIYKYYPDARVVIADDSYDPERHKTEVLSMWSEKNITYLTLPYDVGLSEGRNQALQKVETKYFVLCDDDFVFDSRTNILLMKEYIKKYKADLLGGVFFESLPKRLPYKVAKVVEGTIGLLYDVGIKIPLLFRRWIAGDLFRDSSSGKIKIRKCTLQEANQESVCKVDITDNFFLAKTHIRERVSWSKELKLLEHKDYFVNLKKEGFTCFVCLSLGVSHVRDTGFSFKYHNLRYRKNLHTYRIRGDKK